VEAGELQYSAALKTSNLLKNRAATNAPQSENAAYWNAFGTKLVALYIRQELECP
jgi:hypothetical protein